MIHRLNRPKVPISPARERRVRKPRNIRATHLSAAPDLFTNPPTLLFVFPPLKETDAHQATTHMNDGLTLRSSSPSLLHRPLDRHPLQPSPSAHPTPPVSNPSSSSSIVTAPS